MKTFYFKKKPQIQMAFLLFIACLFQPFPAYSQEEKVDITFGRVVVESYGIDKGHIDSYVNLYDSDGKKVGGGDTGRMARSHSMSGKACTVRWFMKITRLKSPIFR